MRNESVCISMGPGNAFGQEYTIMDNEESTTRYDNISRMEQETDSAWFKRFDTLVTWLGGRDGFDF
ncbi:hypothetical protein EW026_g5991 [Hermanssonia centrifuga]|nr:hypothetical protein EW026_g5991 [Hermanssonia centrifuga]